MKNTLEGTGNRAEQMEERISKLEDREIEMIQVEEDREIRSKQNKEILRVLSDLSRKGSVRVMGVPEGEERGRGTESLFKEIIAVGLPW